jgi:hypothetical protein
VRRPTLRILLLVVFGILVYLKFDSFLSSRIIQTFAHPKFILEAFSHPTPSMPTPILALDSNASTNLKWSSDSMQVDLSCGPGPFEICLNEAQRLSPIQFDANVLGRLRALIHKANLQWQIPATAGFLAHFQKDQEAPEGISGMLLSRLDISDPKAPIVLTAQYKDRATLYCMQERCLDQIFTLPPIDKFTHYDLLSTRPPSLELQSHSGVVFHPVMMGRVVAIDSGSHILKIYHGKNIFSSYSGYASLKPGLKVGSQLLREDAVGMVGNLEDSVGHLSLLIEKDGLYIDPEDFFGLSLKAPEVAHGN